MSVPCRPRLLSIMQARWTGRVVTVVAGAGFGKSTLLAHAVAHHQLSPKGTDILVSGTGADTAESIIERVANAAGVEPGPAGELGHAIVHAHDGPVAVLVDDVHRLPSSALAAVRDFVRGAPEPLGLVLASRHSIPGLARLRSEGRTVDIGERDLRLTSAETADLLAGADGDPDRLDWCGGWPALVVAEAAAPGRAREYVTEEVVGALSIRQRHGLAACILLGGGDLAAIRAVADDPMLDGDDLAGVPLVARPEDGHWVADDVWTRFVSLLVADDDRHQVERRAAGVLLGLGSHDRAFGLFAAAADWEGTATVLRDACSRGYAGPGHEVLERWLGLLPDDVRQRPHGRLLTGVARRRRDPFGDETCAALERAITDCRAEGDVVSEVAALSELAYVLRMRGEMEGLPPLVIRAFELHEAGHPEVAGLIALSNALVQEAAGETEQCISLLRAIPEDVLSREWRASVAYLIFHGYLTLGRTDEMRAAARRCAELGGATYTGRHAVDVAEWYSGDPEPALRNIAEMAVDASTTPIDQTVLGSFVTMVLAYSGRVDGAQEMLTATRLAAQRSSDPLLRGFVTCATVAASAASGDDAIAGEAMRAYLADVGVDSPAGRRELRRVAAVSYVLVPEIRSLMATTDLGPIHDRNITIGAAVAAIRDGGPPSLCEAIEPGEVLVAVPLPWSSELAAALAVADDPRGRLLFDAIVSIHGERGRAAMRTTAELPDERVAKGARRLLADVPVPPVHAVEVELLGPGSIRVAGRRVESKDWQRSRVRALLVFLVLHRRSSRERISAALWPDLDSERAGRNLRVTLAYLQSVVEPERRAGEATFCVRQAEGFITLAGAPHLEVDLWHFEEIVRDADELVAAGAQGLARHRFETAVGLWRGPALEDVMYEDWAAPALADLSRRFVHAASSAGRLALGDDDPAAALRIGERLLTFDRHLDTGYQLVEAAHRRLGSEEAADRARRDRDSMLTSLGVTV